LCVFNARIEKSGCNKTSKKAILDKVSFEADLDRMSIQPIAL